MRDYQHAHLLLDFGATATSYACDLLALRESACVFDGDNRDEIPQLMKRLIRHGAFFTKKCSPPPHYVAYKKKYESTRDTALVLIGIRKYRKSPLIPDGVHCEIIKAIACWVRQTCEEEKNYKGLTPK